MLYRVCEKIKSISNKRKAISLDYEMLYFRFIESFDYLVVKVGFADRYKGSSTGSIYITKFILCHVDISDLLLSSRTVIRLSIYFELHQIEEFTNNII